VPKQRSPQRDLEALFARIEALMDAAPPDPPPTPEYLAWLEQCRREGEAFVAEVKRRQQGQKHGQHRPASPVGLKAEQEKR
jgi:hypothetical protein